MADFSAKVKLIVDTGGNADFQDQINAAAEEAKVSKLILADEAGGTLATAIQEQLNKQTITIQTVKVESIDCSAAIENMKTQIATAMSSITTSGTTTTSSKSTKTTKTTSTTSTSTSSISTEAQQAADAMEKVAEKTAEAASNQERLTEAAQETATAEEQASSATEKQADAQENATDAAKERVTAEKEAADAAKESTTATKNTATAEEQAASATKTKATAEKEAAAAAEDTNKAVKAQSATMQQTNSLAKQMSNYLKSNSKLEGTTYATEIKKMLDVLQSGVPVATSQLNEMKNAFASIQIQAKAAGTTGKTFADVMTSAYEKFGGWSLVTQSMSKAVQQIKQMVTNVVELDTAMTELYKVTDETTTVYNEFFDTATERAQELGATITDTITATADFARLGYDIDDAATLADTAIVYKNVGDGIDDISDASESIISTMQAFGVAAEDAMSIVDKFNEVGKLIA